MIAVSKGWRSMVVGVSLFVAGNVGFTAIMKAQEPDVPPDQFHVGDRVALTIEGPLAFADTVVVRGGLLLRVPNLGDISLRGVRRADAQQYLTEQVGKYVKNPVVRATPLISIGVFGAVGRPGYFSMPSDALLTDVMMRAGGPTSLADPGKTVIKRNGKELVNQQQTQAALTSGKTLEDLKVTSMDQVIIGEKSQRNVQAYLQVGSVVLGLLGLVLTLGRR